MNKKFLLVATLFYMSFATIFQATPPVSSTPTASRVYGDRFVREVQPSQVSGLVGTLDTTFGVNGSLDLSDDSSNSFTGYRAQGIKTLADGSILVGLSQSTTGDHSILAKYTATGILDESFGSFGFVTFDTKTRMSHAMMIDEQGRILIGGCNEMDGAIGWLNRVSADGLTVEKIIDSTDVNDPWVFVGAVATQTTGKIIVLGQKVGSSKYIQMARYNRDLSLDTDFGNNGFILFDGNTTNLPASITILYSMVINADDEIYIPYLNGTSVYVAKFAASGDVDTTWGIQGSIALPVLNGATNFQLHIAADLDNNLIVGAQVGTNIVVTGMTSTGGAISSFTDYTLTGAGNNITAIMTTTDGTLGKIVLIGYDSTGLSSMITCLESNGSLDTVFNDPSGYNYFTINQGAAASQLLNAVLAPDGRLYSVGFETATSVIPYISRLYNFSNMAHVAQYPAEKAQGDIDVTFGSLDSNTGDGIVRSFYGRYGARLQQTTAGVIELAYGTSPGNFLVGMTGKLDTNNNSNMIVAELNADGSLSSQVNLTKVYTNEYLTSIIEDQNGNLLVTGYDATSHAFVRKYPTAGSTGTHSWSSVQTGGASIKNLGVAIQSSQRILVFGQTDESTGIIYAYTPSGDLDVTGFNFNSETPGKITTADFGLTNMGPIYAYAVDILDVIYIAYKNNDTNKVDVALIYQDGHGLIPEFNVHGATPGILPDVFGSDLDDYQDVRIALDNEGQLVIAAAIGGDYKIKQIFSVTGDYDNDFGVSGLVTINAGTDVVINQLTTLNNNMIIITGSDNAADDSMLIVRVTAAGVLDTTFNSQGATPGILPLQIGDIVPSYDTRSATGLVVQAATGNMVVTGYEKQTSTLSIPMTLSIYGEPASTQVKQSPILSPENAGTLDTTFDLDADADSDGSIDLSGIDSGLTGSTRAVYAYRSGHAKQGYILVGVDTGYHTKIVRLRQSDNSLDTSFGDASSGIITLSGVLGLNHISIDADNNILVTGTQSNLGWAKRLTFAGALDLAFESLSSLVEINGLCQQKSGRYIIVGKDNNGNGVLVAFKEALAVSDTALQVDTTFSPLGTTPGWYRLGTTGLYNIAINSDDTILAAYSDTTVKIAKMTANGSGLVTNFANSGTLDTAITPRTASAIRLDIDINEKIIVASSTGASVESLSVVRYSAAGVIDVGFNSGSIYTFPVLSDNGGYLGSAGITLTNLMITHEESPAVDGKIIVMGYNTAGANGRLFVARLGTDGTLDATWNFATPAAPDIAGVLTFSVASGSSVATEIYDGSIYINGAIYGAVAAQGTSNKALLVRIFGDDYVTQVEEQPFEVAAGILDYTLDTATPGSGAYALLHDDGSLAGYQAKKIYIYPSGQMLVGLSNGTDVKVIKYKADRSVDTSFGVNGIATTTNGADVTDMFVANGVNDDGSIYLTGSKDGSAIAIHFSAHGVEMPFGVEDSEQNWWLQFIFQFMDSGTAIRRTKNSRTLIAGVLSNNESNCDSDYEYEGDAFSLGAIIAYDNFAFDSDTMFGNVLYNLYIPYFNDDYEYIPTSNPITDMAVDEFDRIYTVQNVESTIDVKRVLASGSGFDELFAAASITETIALSTTQIKVALDEVNGHLVVAVQDGTTAGNMIKVYRYNTLDGSDAGSINTVTIPGKVLNLSDLFMDEVQNIYVVGNNETNNKLIVARIKNVDATTIELDASYAVGNSSPDVPGIVDVTAGAMTVTTAGAYHQDRRVYCCGYSNDAEFDTPYISRIFGDVYTQEVSEAFGIALQGDGDLTLNPAGTPDGGIDLSILTGWSTMAGWIARSVHTDNHGMTYIALSDGTDLVVGKLNSNMIPVTTFGDSGLSNGLTNGLTMPEVNNLIYDWQGKLVVTGMNGGNHKVIRYEADGATSTVFASSIYMTAATRVVQQKSGRYLVSGKTTYSSGFGGGTILAYKNDGTEEDATYGPHGSNGFYTINIDAQIDDMVVDEYDDTYFVYRDGTVKLQKITANGSGFDPLFNSGIVVDTGITATQPARLGINSEGNILVAASFGTSIATALYNGTTGELIGSVQDLTSSNSNTPILTDITGSATNFVMAAYETTGGEINQMLTIRMTSVGDVDTTFGIAGIAANDPQSATAMYAMTVQLDGKITMVGQSASPNPILMRTYGTPYEEEVLQYPDRNVAGVVDLTLDPAGSGALNLNDLVASVGLDAYTAKRIYEDGSGKMLVVFDNTAHTILVRLYKDLTLDTTFNSGGAGGTVAGSVLIGGQADVRGLAVDSQGNIYVSGGTGSTWLYALNNDGSLLTGFTLPTSTPANSGYEIVLQTLDRILFVGQDDDSFGGALYGYNSITGALDPEFGNGRTGVYNTGVASPITDVAIDNLDRIYIVYNDGSGNSTLQRINTNGSLIDTAFGTQSGIQNVINHDLKVLVDETNEHVIVAAATNSGFALQSYLVADGSTVAGPVTITVGESSTSHLANIYVTSDNKIVLAGYETTGNRIVVARYNADLTYDTLFNPAGMTPGLLLTTVGSMTTVFDATIHADNRIMLVGGATIESTVNPFMARVFGDDYVTIDAQIPTLGTAGTLDATFNLGDAHINFDDSGIAQDGVSHAQVGNALVIDSVGRVVVTGQTADEHMYLARYLSTGEFDITFNSGSINGGPGYIIDPVATIGNGLALDDAGNILVVGSYQTEGDTLYLGRYTSDGLLDTTFANGDYPANIYGQPGYLGNLGAETGYGIALDSQGNILVIGVNWNNQLYIARYTPAGFIDTTFNETGSIYDANLNIGYGIAVDSNDKIVIAGQYNGYLCVARYTSAGAIDTTFNIDLITGRGGTRGYIYDTNSAGARAVVIDEIGNILIAGQGAEGGVYVARYTEAGGRDTTFNTYGYLFDYNGEIAYSIDISRGSTLPGYVFISGVTADSNSQYIAAYTPDGELGGYITDTASWYGLGLKLDASALPITSGTTADGLEVYVARYTSGGQVEVVFGAGSSTPGTFVDTQVKAVLPLLNGTQYIVLDDESSASRLIRLSQDALSIPGLDLTFQTDGIADVNAPYGTFALFMDALENIIITGTDGDGGWVQRYTSTGDLDTTFATAGLISELSGIATVAIEQSMARIVVAGQGTTNGCLRGYEPDGSVDLLFGTDGVYDTGVTTGVYTLVADEYDRLILAYKNGLNVDVVRLTSNGELDITFGTNNSGIITSALTDVSDNESSIRVTLNEDGNIVVVAVSSDGTNIKVALYDNNSAALANGNGLSGEISLAYTLTDAVLTSLTSIKDGKVIVGGYQSGSNDMWLARITSSGFIDTSFNPSVGFMPFSFEENATALHNNALGIFEDGRISCGGYELVGGIHVPFVARVYNTPYEEEVPEYLSAQPIGANDLTFGLTGNNIVTFYASAGANASDLQKAQAIGLEGNNRFILAFDGRDDSSSTASRLFINRFNMDGILDTTFNTTGQATLPLNYDNEYVRDMVVYTSPEGINKAILAGYGRSTALSVTSSLLISYDLDSVGFDNSFGGFDQDPVGQAFADIESHQVVGRQTSGRIVTAGVTYENNGAIVGYTSIGKLDKTFGSDGFYFPANMIDGLYTHAIDTLDRVVFAYIDSNNSVVLARLLADGSGLDLTFNTVGFVTTGIASIATSSDIRVAVDNNGKVIVAAMAGNALLLTIERYNDDGTLDTAVNTDEDIIYGFTAGTISKLLIDQDNKILVVGTDRIGEISHIYVLRILADMSDFDTSFNEVGYILYNDTNVQSPRDALIHPDGRVVIVGSETEERLP